MIYYKKNILKETQNIVFFDIDGTLSSTNEWQLLMDNPKYKFFKESFYQQWKTIKLVDFRNLNHISVALFANLLRQSNSKAVCISSWNVRGSGICPDLYFQQLKESFESIYQYFPENWLLGYLLVKLIVMFQQYNHFLKKQILKVNILPLMMVDFNILTNL